MLPGTGWLPETVSGQGTGWLPELVEAWMIRRRLATLGLVVTSRSYRTLSLRLFTECYFGGTKTINGRQNYYFYDENVAKRTANLAVQDLLPDKDESFTTKTESRNI